MAVLWAMSVCLDCMLCGRASAVLRFLEFFQKFVSVLFLQNVPIFRDYMYVCGCVRDSVYVYIRINLWDDLRTKQNVLFPYD